MLTDLSKDWYFKFRWKAKANATKTALAVLDDSAELKFGKNRVLMSVYLTSAKDPQRQKTHEANQFLKVRSWLQTAKRHINLKRTDIFLFVDTASKEFCAKISPVVCVRVQQKGWGRRLNLSTNDWRFLIYEDFLKKAGQKKYEWILTTDLFDVEFGGDPFEYMEEQNKMHTEIFAAFETEDTFFDNWVPWVYHGGRQFWERWVRESIERCYKPGEAWFTNREGKRIKWSRWKGGKAAKLYRKMEGFWNSTQFPTVNPGVFGGKRKPVIEIIEKFNNLLGTTTSIRGQENCNFGLFAYVLYQKWEAHREMGFLHTKIGGGIPFNSPFKSYSRSRDRLDASCCDYYIYHK